MIDKARVRILISVGAVALFAIKVLVPGLAIDAVALGLIALAVLPWLASTIESAKMPGGWEVKFRDVEREQVKQREDLDFVLTFLLENFVTSYELVHLEKLAGAAPFPFSKSDTFEAELRRLLAVGLLQRKPGKGLRSLLEAGDDVHAHIEITTRGREYLAIRRKLLSHLG